MNNDRFSGSVCILTSQYFGGDKIGGFGSMSRALAESLSERGVPTSVIVPQRKEEPTKEVLNGVTIFRFAPFNICAAINLINTVKTDIFHSQDPSLLTLIAQLFRKNSVHVVTCRDPRDRLDWINEFVNATARRRFKIPLNWFLEGSPLIKIAVKRADAVFAPAHYLLQKIQKIYNPPRKPNFLPNLITVPDLVPKKSNTPILVFLGRLDKRKRPELFLELSVKHPEWHFIVVGRAESAARDNLLRDKYGKFKNVEWVGFLDRFKKPEMLTEILHRSWVLVNTASREGLPLSFLEAAAHGCAIVSEVNPDGFADKFGLQIKDGDFCKGLEQFLSTPSNVFEKGLAARNYVKNNYEHLSSTLAHIEAYRRSKKGF